MYLDYHHPSLKGRIDPTREISAYLDLCEQRKRSHHIVGLTVSAISKMFHGTSMIVGRRIAQGVSPQISVKHECRYSR